MNLFRLIAAPLLLVTASLAVFRAPTHLLWMVAVGVTEWGHALALICLAAAIPLAGNSWSGRLAVILCVAAAALSLTPVYRAARLDSGLSRQLGFAFGDSKPNVTV